MTLELILVLGLIGTYQKLKWTKTRQSLAFNLLGSMIRVCRHSINMVEIMQCEGKRMLLNNRIELHLLKLQTALANFNEQTIVHLPALLPEISENLSEITRKISGLEEAAANINYHLEILAKDIELYDPDKPAKGWVDVGHFEYNEKNHFVLKDGAEQSDGHYLVLTIVSLYSRLIGLSEEVDKYVSNYKRGWKGLGDKRVKDSKEREDELLTKKEEVKRMKDRIEELGIYLVRFSPDPKDTPTYEN